MNALGVYTLRCFLFTSTLIFIPTAFSMKCSRAIYATRFMPHNNDLPDERLATLYKQVFGKDVEGQKIILLQDLPNSMDESSPNWQERIITAAKWTAAYSRLGANARLLFYPAVGAANADLPHFAWEFNFNAALPVQASDMKGAQITLLNAVLDGDTVIAPTEKSATAPLRKVAAGTSLRGVTMPGWNSLMIPALDLDLSVVKARCNAIKAKLDTSASAEINFSTGPVNAPTLHKLVLDLRHRTSLASHGAIESPGDIGNLPTGETFIVPYEGEKAGIPSLSSGTLPVQFGSEVVVYRVENNRAVEVLSRGPASDAERKKLLEEPAYGNIAELGLGVLGDLGIHPIGEILLDEKLGLHIAFGRSDHIGGVVGPSFFTSPQRVTHIDRIFLSETQPSIRVLNVLLHHYDGSVTQLMRNGAYLPTIFSPGQ